MVGGEECVQQALSCQAARIRCIACMAKVAKKTEEEEEAEEGPVCVCGFAVSAAPEF